MPPRVAGPLRFIVALLCCAAVGCFGTPSATAAPRPAPATGGTSVGKASSTSGVHIIKSLSGPSCTGYSSQSAPPATIRVLVHNSKGTATGIVTVPFLQYVENVLPNEWIASWDSDALMAGAVAVKSYGWFWVTHLGGYFNTPSNCFDVTDDTAFQVYRAGSAMTRTNSAVTASWSVITRKSSKVLQASYICSLPFTAGKTSCSVQGPKEKCGAGANGAQLSQYGSQACAKAGMTYRNILLKYYGSTLQLATTTPNTHQLLTPDDFTFRGRSMPAVWDRTSGMWTLGSDPTHSYQWGLPGDVPVMSNAGDGRALVGVFRAAGGLWYVKDVLAGGWTRTAWGTSGDIPVQAHYRGVDQPTVLAVFRPSNGRWYLRGTPSTLYGQAGDVPVPGHYTGSSANHFADQRAVFRPSTGEWYIIGVGIVRWGTQGDIPVPADYNGDGKTDVAVYRPSTQRWYVKGTPSVQWGQAGDIPLTGDFNGDGKFDIAVFRPANHTWYVYHQPSTVLGSTRSIPAGKAPYSS